MGNIGIDIRVLERKMTGIGRFLSGVLQHIPSIDKKNNYYLFSYNKTYADDDYYTSIYTKSLKTSKLYTPFWLNYTLPKLLKQHTIDLFFSPNYLVPLRRKKSGWKNVAVIHDISHRLKCNYHSLLYTLYLDVMLPPTIRNCDAIITDTEHSRKAIINSFQCPPNKIHAIWLAADTIFHPRDLSPMDRTRIGHQYGLPDTFFLYVGIIEIRKNILGIIKIHDILQRMGYRIPQVLIGRPGWGSQAIMHEIQKRKNILYIPYVDNNDLPLIYNLASVFIFPSFYEGFGLPPLEAMQSGIPVITSNIAALREIVDNGGIMHDPSDYQAFAQDIIRLIHDNAFNQEMRKRGMNRASKFSFNITARRIVGVFNEVMAK